MSGYWRRSQAKDFRTTSKRNFLSKSSYFVILSATKSPCRSMRMRVLDYNYDVKSAEKLLIGRVVKTRGEGGL